MDISRKILRKLRNSIIENKDNRKEISNLFNQLRDIERIRGIYLKKGVCK